MSSNANDPRPAEGWRERIHEVILRLTPVKEEYST